MVLDTIPWRLETRCPSTSLLKYLQNLTKGVRVKGAKVNMEAYDCNTRSSDTWRDGGLGRSRNNLVIYKMT